MDDHEDHCEHGHPHVRKLSESNTPQIMRAALYEALSHGKLAGFTDEQKANILDVIAPRVWNFTMLQASAIMGGTAVTLASQSREILANLGPLGFATFCKSIANSLGSDLMEDFPHE